MESPVLTDRVLSIEEYISDFTELPVDDRYLSTLDDLRDYLDDFGYEDTWDRPLSEIDEVIESESPVVLVTDGTDYRWFEVVLQDPNYLGGI